MKTTVQDCTRYILDTYKSIDKDAYIAGALLYKGRKQIESVRWKGKSFDSQYEADEFARKHCISLGLQEALNLDELARANPR